MDTYTHVDYISISTKHANWGVSPTSDGQAGDYVKEVVRAVLQAYPHFVQQSMAGGVDEGGGGSGYQHRLFFRFGGWTIFYGATHGHILIQLPGEACHLLRDESGRDGVKVGLSPIFSSPLIKCTRIDIACNWRCDLSPDEVASYFRKKDVRDYPRFPSQTGVTQYIGSPTSEKSVKVYRYEKPHPRHEWLRVEFRFNAPMSQQVQTELAAGNMLPVYVGALIDWGFDAANMLNPIAHGVEQVSLAYKKRQDAGSLAWVYGTALTGVRDAILRGEMDYEWAIRFLKGEVD